MVRKALTGYLTSSKGGPQNFFWELGSYGCYFLSLAYVGAIRVLNPTEIFDLALKCEERGFIGENFYVNNPVGIANLAADITNPPRRFMDVLKLPADADLRSDMTLIVCLNQKNSLDVHFVVGGVRDNELYITYDPIGGATAKSLCDCKASSWSARNGEIASYRRLIAVGEGK